MSTLILRLARYFAPLWVVTDCVGRGVGSLLIRDGLQRADSATPPEPVYLETTDDGKPIYEYYGFKGVQGRGADMVMIKNAPPSISLAESAKAVP